MRRSALYRAAQNLQALTIPKRKLQGAEELRLQNRWIVTAKCGRTAIAAWDEIGLQY